jgi:hypothetical protein
MSIFISYRRSDDAVGYANQLSTTLRRHFGDDQVFRDITSIPPGADFEVYLHEVLASCKVMLVVIGRRWLAEPGQGGGPNRLFDPGDWVRNELSVALDRGIMLIPVVVAGAEMPAADALPEPLQGLLRRQAQVLDDRHWDDDIRQLIDHLGTAGGIRPLATAPGGGPANAPPEPPAGAPDNEAVQGEPEGAGGFFRRLPNRVQWLAKLVAGLAALVAAAAGLVATLKGDPGSEPPAPPPPPVSTEADGAVIEGYRERQGKKPDCYKGHYDYFKYLPFSLHPTLKDSPAARKHLYWFRFWGQNDCDYPLEIVIKFRSKLPEPIVEYEPAEFSGRIKPGEKDFDRRMHPGFEFPGGDVDDTLQVEWEIVGENGRLDSGEEEIVVLGKEQFVWGLPSPTSDGIDSAFLLAGLSAWAIPNSELVRQRAKNLREELDLGGSPLDVVTAFMRGAYQGVFRGSPPEIALSPSAHAFPPPGNPYGSRPIRPAPALFEARAADQLEAALLLSSLAWAITKEKGVSLVLFSISVPGSVPRFLLAWNAPGQWAGIDTDTIADMPFEQNAAETAAEIRELLAERPEIAAALGSETVYFRPDDPVIAVDLTRAATRHGIKHLP